MAIQINGNGTITGISAGGLPAGTVTSATLASGVGGKVLQVINNVATDVISLTNQQSWTVVPGTDQNGSGSAFALTVTPASATSKFLITFQLKYAGTNNDVSGFRWQRGSTALTKATNTGNRVAVGATGNYEGNNSNNISPTVAYQILLDSPNTTSQIVYAPYYYKYHSDTAYLNRSVRDTEGSTYDQRCTSELTLMEIAA